MNKKMIFFFFGITLPLFIKAQVMEELSLNESGKITINEVVKVDSVSKKELYLRGKQFFIYSFKSANEVIQMDDNIEGILIGEGFNDVTINTKMANISIVTQLWFTVKIQVKDGRYKYEIFDLYFKNYPSDGLPSIATPAENLLTNQNNIYVEKMNERKKKELHEIQEQYKSKMIKNINDLITTIKKSMANNSSVNW